MKHPKDTSAAVWSMACRSQGDVHGRSQGDAGGRKGTFTVIIAVSDTWLVSLAPSLLQMLPNWTTQSATTTVNVPLTLANPRGGLQRFTLAFGLSGAVLAILATRLAGQATGLAWLLVGIEAYLALCLFSLAAAYGLREAGVSVEECLLRPGWSIVFRALLLPYLVLGAITLFLARWFDREGLLNPVVPGLSIGRLPFPFERPRLREAGIEAVLNLCWEFPRLSGIDREPGIATAHVPILDGAPPSDAQFQKAVEHVSRWRAEGRCVLIHCAQGHGRTATITAAVLLRLGLASDVEEALAMVRAARPFARPSLPQKRALSRYTSGSRPRQG